jgi:hypothetical protein
MNAFLRIKITDIIPRYLSYIFKEKFGFVIDFVSETACVIYVKATHDMEALTFHAIAQTSYTTK